MCLQLTCLGAGYVAFILICKETHCVGGGYGPQRQSEICGGANKLLPVPRIGIRFYGRPVRCLVIIIIIIIIIIINFKLRVGVHPVVVALKRHPNET
jgi:hypothetical protein